MSTARRVWFLFVIGHCCVRTSTSHVYKAQDAALCLLLFSSFLLFSSLAFFSIFKSTRPLTLFEPLPEALPTPLLVAGAADTIGPP